jgi:Fe-S-cluster containining protein
METEVTEITNEDLRQYYKTLSNRCKIRLVRSKMYNSMPKSVKVEFQSRVNDLIEMESGVYEIRAEKASEELKVFLAKFKFKLIDIDKSDLPTI